MHNLQQLRISIIALWVCLLDYGYQYFQLWRSIMTTHDTIMDIHKEIIQIWLSKLYYGYL